MYFDDGKVIGIVMEILNDGCNLEIKMGGAVRSHCQVRFIGGKHDKLSILNQKDINDFSAVSREIQIDFLVVPFVTSAEDVQNLRDMLGAGGKNIQLIAKIDGINGLENFDEIISKADGVVF